MTGVDEAEPRTHYHFRISLRVRHPAMDPEQITQGLPIEPTHSWKAGEPRQTPAGTPLAGSNRDSFWNAEVAAGRWPSKVNEAIWDELNQLVRHRSFLHRLRAEDGAVELFVGWFFENQSGDVLAHQCLALAGDLQIDLSFDIFSPQQPQHEYEIRAGMLPEWERGTLTACGLSSGLRRDVQAAGDDRVGIETLLQRLDICAC